jgi:hypothetical protein
LLRLSSKDQRQGRAADEQRDDVGLAGQQRLREFPELAQRLVASHRKTEEFRQLTDQHGQRDAVHVAVTDRLGEQFGDEAETRDAGEDAQRARDHGHHPGQRDGAQRVAAGQRQDDREDHGGQRGIRPEDHDPAWSEQRVGEQRNDRRVQAVDAGHARGHGVGDADRHQHGGQHQAGGDVVAQPGDLVLPQGLQARQPLQPAGRLAGSGAGGEAARR